MPKHLQLVMPKHLQVVMPKHLQVVMPKHLQVVMLNNLQLGRLGSRMPSYCSKDVMLYARGLLQALHSKTAVRERRRTSMAGAERSSLIMGTLDSRGSTAQDSGVRPFASATFTPPVVAPHINLFTSIRLHPQRRHRQRRTPSMSK